MHGELKLALAGYRHYLDWDSPWLFPGKNKAKPLTLQAFDLVLRQAISKAKLAHRGISTHSFRRTVITRLQERGCDIRLIQEITGDQDLKSLQRYVEISPERVKQAYASL
jgi:integrase/recombinase XerD